MCGMGKRICFVSLTSYPLLSGKRMAYVGGAEVDQVLLARELVKHGFDVSFITYSEGRQGGMENAGDIEVIKAFQRDNTPKSNLLSRSLRFLSISCYMWRAMQKAAADNYFSEGVSAVVALFCYLKRRRFVYCIPSDRDVVKGNIISHRFIDELSKRLVAKLASAIVTQNEHQAKMLRQNFNRECVVIPPAYPLSAGDPKEKKATPPIVLSVANIRPVKQPEIFLQLAEAIPEARFQMIGGRSVEAPTLYDRIRDSAAKIANLEFLGFIPFHEVDQYFEQASIFVNTSSIEGFPTTFVEAWAAYMPVVSLNIDPSEVIHYNKLGFHSKTFQKMVDDTKLLLKDEKLRTEMGQNVRMYMEREHDIKVVTAKYLKVLERIEVK